MKHINLKAHWLSSLIPHTLSVAFVRREDKYADATTKNLPGAKQERFTHHFNNATIEILDFRAIKPSARDKKDVKQHSVFIIVKPEEFLSSRSPPGPHKMTTGSHLKAQQGGDGK